MSSHQEALDRVELVLNRLRWKYLQAIALSPALRESPAQAVSFAFNAAFLSLAGVKRTLRCRDMGFGARARYELAWDQDREDLASALDAMSRCPDASGTYAEVIALKPGFHEAWVHETFPKEAEEGPYTPRGRVFAILRGSPLGLIDLAGRYPADLSDPDCFLAYAPCAVTEGPLVRRKHQGVSYFAEVKRVGTIPSIAMRQGILHESFKVLDTCQRLRKEDTTIGLARLIEEAEEFIHCPYGQRPLLGRF